MHHSLHDVLLPHEDFVGVYPTHGAGSLCSTGISAAASSTIGYERRYDPLLSLEIDAFARALLDGQPAFPPYFARMRPMNQAGPPLLDGRVPEIEAFSLEAFDMWLGRGAFILDARPPEAHAAGHVIGSLSVPAGPSFGTWLGWMVPADASVLLIVEDPSELDDLARQALRIGFDGLVGHLSGGFETWWRSGRTVAAGGRLELAGLARALDADPAERPFVIDVRQASEYAEGHVPGSHHIFAGDLAERLAEVPRDRPIACICASGYRSSVAASLLRARGFEDVSWVADGIPAWEEGGYPVARGESAG
jgi:hydroxyacylglutathione hydrolase